jgi:hypothetical protein
MRGKMILVVAVYLVTLVAMVATSSVSKASIRIERQTRQVRASSQVMTKETAKRLSTDMRFSGARVGGQYQVPGEATARVENEKPIEELLGLRTQFRDRIKQDEERE